MLLTRTAALFLVSSLCYAQSSDLARLPGHWSGPMSFKTWSRNGGLMDENGGPGADLHIQRDLTLTGTVGGATIKPCRPWISGTRYGYEAILEGDIRPHPGFSKRRLIFEITRVGQQELQAKFSLESVFAWDWTVYHGRLVAAKMP